VDAGVVVQALEDGEGGEGFASGWRVDLGGWLEGVEGLCESQLLH
jgi:hypothetical protein